MYGKKVYQATGNSNSEYTFGKTIASEEYLVRISCERFNKTIKIIKAR
jgi:hypothetical protein